MMQAIFETIFDICYLSGVITAGILMFRGKSATPLVKKFGIMAVILGSGDAFHLVPRMYALWTTGLAANAAALGIGKLITSVTMTIFYLILYYIWRGRYNVKGRKSLDITIWVLAVVRVLLCLFPQNDWLNPNQPVSWGVLRNIPFAIMGIIVIVLFWQEATKAGDKVFRHMPLAITLSFAFYIPVVLWGSVVPLVGMFMIPKTLAYAWIVSMGWQLHRAGRKHNK